MHRRGLGSAERSGHVALATSLLAGWGAGAWAVGQQLGGMLLDPTDAFTASLGAGLIVASVVGLLAFAALLVGWAPEHWLVSYMAAILQRRHRRWLMLVYATPVLAHAVCVVFAPAVGSTHNLWPVASVLMSCLPTALLLGAHGWLLAPDASESAVKGSARTRLTPAGRLSADL